MRTSATPETKIADHEELLTIRTGVPIEVIGAFCERWHVGELAVFGSVLRDDFGPDSDTDILIRFNTTNTPGLFGIARMEMELGDLFGRKVDLVTHAAVEASRNYIRRKAILGSAQVVYVA